jgi:CheY-like chemotaxis protein
MIEIQPFGPRPVLSGSKILVVEDETIVSLLLEDMLSELGCSEVWLTANVAAALGVLGTRRPDAAVLDVNLGRETVYPVADKLAVLEIPFIFATGYGRFGIQEKWASRPIIQKPYDAETLLEAMAEVLKVLR